MREPTLYLILVILSSPGTNTVSNFNVTEIDTHTLHRNGSVSVTCRHDNKKATKMDAKLMRGEEIVCELEKENCSLTRANLSVTFTLWNLKAGDEDKLYNCRLFQTSPRPILKGNGKPAKLFSGSRIPFPPPRDTACAPAPTSSPVKADSEPSLPTDPLVWVLTAVSVCLCLYGFLITILYLKLKVSRKEVLYDALRYVPVQQHQVGLQSQGQVWSVHDPKEGNGEYMDMREVQPKAWTPRDLNHNSHTANDFTV